MVTFIIFIIILTFRICCSAKAAKTVMNKNERIRRIKMLHEAVTLHNTVNCQKVRSLKRSHKSVFNLL